MERSPGPPGYRETDPPHPVSIYAESKRWAEVHVEHLLNKFYIVRTSWLFGPSRSTYADKVMEWAQKGMSVPCLKDMKSAPTYTPDLAKALLQLAESGLWGLYHLTNGGFCSRVEFAEGNSAPAQTTGRKLLKPMTQAEFNHPAKRPAFSGLDNLAWRLNGFDSLRSWQEALRDHFAAVRTPAK